MRLLGRVEPDTVPRTGSDMRDLNLNGEAVHCLSECLVFLLSPLIAVGGVQQIGRVELGEDVQAERCRRRHGVVHIFEEVGVFTVAAMSVAASGFALGLWPRSRNRSRG